MAVKGLFGGPTPQDIRQLMNQENELRIRQAGQDSKAGGYQAQLMSQATERGRQALGNIFGGAMGAFGMEMPQDPRLSQAVKRESTRVRMNEMFKDAGADGKITPEEYDAIANEMSASGFQAEAADVIKRKQNEYGTSFQRSESKKQSSERLQGQEFKTKQAQMARNFKASETTLARAQSQYEFAVRMGDKKETEKARLAFENKKLEHTKLVDKQNREDKKTSLALAERRVKELEKQGASKIELDKARQELEKQKQEFKESKIPTPKKSSIISSKDRQSFLAIYNSGGPLEDDIDAHFGNTYGKIDKEDQIQLFSIAKDIMTKQGIGDPKQALKLALQQLKKPKESSTQETNPAQLYKKKK
jgi:hypothetical protein